jgi:hypothetical protein
MNKLPAVGRIEGAALHKAESPQDATVDFQYIDVTGEPQEISMPFLEALHLLNLLQKMREALMHTDGQPPTLN